MNEIKPQFSLLGSDRWETMDGGEFGALVSFSHRKHGWREDQKGAGNSIARADLVLGQTVIAPNGTSETTSIGERERNGGRGKTSNSMPKAAMRNSEPGRIPIRLM